MFGGEIRDVDFSSPGIGREGRAAAGSFLLLCSVTLSFIVKGSMNEISPISFYLMSVSSIGKVLISFDKDLRMVTSVFFKGLLNTKCTS